MESGAGLAYALCPICLIYANSAYRASGRRCKMDGAGSILAK